MGLTGTSAAKVAVEKVDPLREPIWRLEVRPARISSIPAAAKAASSRSAASSPCSSSACAPCRSRSAMRLRVEATMTVFV